MRWWAVATVVGLIAARSAVFVLFEHAHFDSDQAIVGLMAKHLSEGRAFPLFFYGQSFLLGVEAWLAVPWFWALGPTVAALKCSLLASNVLVGAGLVVGLMRYGGLGPWAALLSSAFFALAPPLTAARLMEAQGGNVEPFVFIILLWWLRARPLWFGSVLAIGFLTREFVIYAVPVLLVAELFKDSSRRAEAARHWLMVVVAFLVVWDGVQLLAPYADLMGPGTRGMLVDGQSGSQLANLGDRVALTPSDWPARAHAAVTRTLPELLGARTSGDPLAPQGHDWLAPLLALGFLAGVGRIVWLLRRPGRGLRELPGFGAYLLGIGVCAAAVFVVARPVEAAPVRYVLLGLCIPIGFMAVWFGVERNVRMRAAMAAAVLVWTMPAAVDHVRQFSRFAVGVPDEMRAVADALDAGGVELAEAEYWRAYKLTFLTREHVIVGSTDFVRISAYQEAVARRRPDVRRLQEGRCEDGRPVAAGWYLCGP